MLIFNKYKPSSYLNIENSIDIELSYTDNAFKILSLFNHSKKLIRSLLLLHFYLYTLYPFCSILFRGTARYHIKLDSTILIFIDDKCCDSYIKYK